MIIEFLQNSIRFAAPLTLLLTGANPAFAEGHASITKENWLKPEVNVTSFQNPGFAQLTAVISRKSTPPSALAFSPISLEGFTFEGSRERAPGTIGLNEYLVGTHTDALVVLHNGEIVYERYFNGMTPYQRHLMMSVTKSFAGTMVAMLVAEGVLDEDEKVSTYIPELAGSDLGTNTVREVLDMRTGIGYSEDYADPEADVWSYLSSIALIPRPEDYDGPQTIREYLPMMARVEPASGNFEYTTPLSEVLVWLTVNATGMPFHQALSERIWSKIGAEFDAQILTEGSNQALGGSGLIAVARDLARFGQMILQRGTINGNQVMLPGVVEGFIAGGDRQAFERHASKNPDEEGYSYRDQWWVTHNEHNAFTAWGVHGQFVYIDPTANMVIVKQSSQPVALLPFAQENDFQFFHALAKHLMAVR